MKDGGWILGEKGWSVHPSEAGRVAKVHADAMARIDRAQADYPRCRVCGQRALVLTSLGLCSKIDTAHGGKPMKAGRR